MNCLVNEIVDSGDGLDTGKAATSDHEGQQGPPYCRGAFRVGFFEMGYKAIS
jgi:hypothetical protein